MSKKAMLISMSVFAAVGVLAVWYLLLPASDAEAQTFGQIEAPAQSASGDLSVLKYSTSYFGVEPGGLVTYVVYYSWTGAGTAPSVRVVDTLPSGVDLFSSDPAPDSQTGQELTYDIGTISPLLPFGIINIVGRVDPSLAESTRITNTVTISGDVVDTDSTNNEASAGVNVQTPKPDLWILKLGLLEEGEYAMVAERDAEFNFWIMYMNFGFGSAPGVMLTDTLPSGVEYVSASPPPTSQSGQKLVWNLDDLSMFEVGEVTIKVRPTVTGTLTNKVDISTSAEEETSFSNQSQFLFHVVPLLPPRITHPSPPDGAGSLLVTPDVEFEGLSRAGSTVILFAGPQETFTPALFTPILTTTAGSDRVFSGSASTTLSDGDHYIHAKAISGTDTTRTLTPLHLVVSSTLSVDPGGLSIETGGQSYDPGGLGGTVGGTPGETVTITVVVSEALCVPLTPALHITETVSGETYPPLDPVETVASSGRYTYTFAFTPESAMGSYEYEMWFHYYCLSVLKKQPIVVILIDPAGYVYDRDEASRDVDWPEKPDDDYLIVNATVTCEVRTGDNSWETWNASQHDQHNPQVTDINAEDGVKDPGYYAFFVPSGQYKVIATAQGCADYESPILTVIDEPVYHNVGMRCTQSVRWEGHEIYLPLVRRSQ